MTNVLLRKVSISTITHQIEKMQTESESAQNKIRSALNGLDFEVASKKNIEEQLRGMLSATDSQISISQQCKSAFIGATNAVLDGDNKYGAESKSIFQQVKSYVDSKLSSIKEFFVKNKLAKYAAISGLFLACPTCAITMYEFELLKKIAMFFKGFFIHDKNNSNKNDNKDIGNSSDNEECNNTSNDSSESDKDNTSEVDNTSNADEPVDVSPYEQYRAKADAVNNDSNVHYQGQLDRVTKGEDGTYYKNTGICNVCSTEILLNRKLAADGKGEQTFTTEDVLTGLGCTDIARYDGTYNKCDKYGNVYDTGTGEAYEYSGNSGSSGCAGTYSNGSGTTYSITSESSATFYQNMTNNGYNEPTSYVASILDNHPEGIVLRNSSASHVVVITDYEVSSDGSIQLYVSDPSNVRYQSQNRIPLEQTYIYGKNNNIFSNMEYIAYIS